MSKPEPNPPIYPIDALNHIRALIEGSCETTYGTRAEPIIQLIRDVVDKALPPVPKR